MAKQHHVVPQDGGWAVRAENEEAVLGVFKTKEEAIDYARKVSREQKTELFIHNQNGTISGKDSHGNDPYPPKG